MWIISADPRRVAPRAWFVAGVIVAALLGACGEPAYTYVEHSKEGTFFKVPASWRQVDDQALDALFGRDPLSIAGSGQPPPDVWAVAFDAAKRPSAKHLFAAHTQEPIVYASVETLPAERRGSVSLDYLRDQLLPVSPAARFAQQQSGQPSAPSAFSLLRDQVLTPGGGIRGVREIFVYRFAGGPPQVFDQTAFANDDASRIYLLFVRCSLACYQERKAEIDDVATSFTVERRS